MELFLGTFSRQIQSIKNLQLTRSVTTIWLRNINLISIDYGFRPRLRCRLTLRGLTLRNVVFGEEVFASFIVTYVISHFWYLRILHRYPFKGCRRSATSCSAKKLQIHNPVYDLAPLHLRRRNSIRPVSCYLSLKDGCF